ncbi:imidazole glycerol phosphate synthase subunit HisH [Candidatus Vidania fulgoroideorum]
MTIGIISIGTGNLYSLYTAFKNLFSGKIIIINNFKKFKLCDKIVFPGQGNSNIIKKNFKNLDIINKLKKEIIFKKKKFFGICLGNQIVFNQNNESNINGMGLFNIKVQKFKYRYKFKIPCVGWCKTQVIKKNILFNKVTDLFFYHSHSYYVPTNKYSIGICFYNTFFSSACLKHNIFLTQFHPEISGISGLKIINNFINW